MASVAIQFMNRVNDFLKLHGIDDEAIKTLNSVLYFKSGKFIYQKSIRQFMYCNYIDEIFQKFKWSELFDESGYTKEEVIKWRRLRGSSKGGSAPNKRKSTKKRIAWNKGKKLHYDTWSKGKTKYDHPSLMKMSEDRKGELNPYHSMSEESKIKMAEKVSASMKLAIKEGRFTPKTENRLYRTTSKLIYNNKSYDQPKRQYEEDVLVLEEEDQVYKLVLHNDDVNTFDFVIMCLIEICEHTLEQAEQCTILVHYKGKCTVKTGALEKLKPMHQALLDKGLSSEIV